MLVGRIEQQCDEYLKLVVSTPHDLPSKSRTVPVYELKKAFSPTQPSRFKREQESGRQE
jgi:hypothetical protein